MKYEFISACRSEFAVEKMCQVLRVSKSGYYAWSERGMSPRDQENEELLNKIIGIHGTKRKQCYGSPRIYKELLAEGVQCGKNRIARIMRLNGIKAKGSKKYKATTDSQHNQPMASNLLKQDFSTTGPDKLWLSDITYIWTGEGWLYLAVILDAWSRKVVGWAMEKSLHRELVLNALKQAYWKRKPAAGLTFHSDRGVQYASSDVRQLLTDYKMIQSMSSTGNCYDNAMMESFFHTLKTELVYHEHYLTRQQAISNVFEYIEIFYNRERRHSSIGYISPAAFEKIAVLQYA